MAEGTLGSEQAGDPYDRPGGNGGESPGEGRSNFVVVLLALLLIGALAWALVATFVEREESAGPEAGITLSELASDGEALIGSTVIVSGEISEVVGPADTITPGTTAGTGFVIGEGRDFVLVVGTQIPQIAALRGDEDLAEGDVVQVSGTVHEFDIEALEEDLDADLVDAQFAAFDERPVLMASAVNLVPTTAARQGEDLVLAVGELTDSPADYLAQRITVRGVGVDEADEILSPRAFEIDDDILVVGATGPTDVQAGFDGTVTGTLIEASTARLLNAIDLPSTTPSGDLFEQIGVDEQRFAEYDYVLVATELQGGG